VVARIVLGNYQADHLWNSKKQAVSSTPQRESSMAHHCTISTESGSGSPALPFYPTLADRGLLGVAVGAALAPGPAIEATAPAKAQIATAELRECRAMQDAQGG